MVQTSTSFDTWLAALEARHLSELSFREVARGLRALSATYVARRQKLTEGGVLASAGKRAAFGLFYAPLHYLLVRHIVDQLPPPRESSSTLVDLGCGTGAAGAACAEARSVKTVVGVDKHPWALGEAAHTYRAFDLSWRMRHGDIGALPLPRERVSFVSAYTLNEVPDTTRETLLVRLFTHRPRLCELLVVEPLARAVVPWWSRWRREFLDAGGRADEWRMRVDLPPILAKLDRAAGLDHRELTGRTLWIQQ